MEDPLYLLDQQAVPGQCEVAKEAQRSEVVSGVAWQRQNHYREYLDEQWPEQEETTQPLSFILFIRHTL